MFNDMRFALRVIAKSRAFIAVVVLALAIGIGANTAIFTMADAIMLHPYVFPQLDRIVALWTAVPAVSKERYGVSPGDYFDWRDQSRCLASIAAYQPWPATITRPDGPERVNAYRVTPEFFSVLRVPALKGALTTSQDEVLVSYGFWQHRLAGDPQVVGRVLEMNGVSYTIAGVMGKDMDFPMYAEIWFPWIATPEERHDRSKNDLSVIARLASGVTLTQARSEMRRISTVLAHQYPLTNAGRSAGLMLLRDTVNEYASRFMVIVSGAVLFLLVLACANVANLQLARGAARHHEMALRLALGSGRWRLVRQLIVEGVMVSFAGGCLGVPLAIWALSLIRATFPALVARHLPGLAYATLDERTLVFTLITGVLTGVAFTIPSAAQACSGRLQDGLRAGGRGTVASGAWMRSALVVSEIVFAVTLLIGSGLMLKGFRNLLRMNHGFDAADIWTFRIGLPERGDRDKSVIVNFYREVLRRMGSIPGVESAALTSELPALADSRSSPVVIEGQPSPPTDHPLIAEVRIISADYFRAMAIPVHAGRGFSAQDSDRTLPVAVISKSAAQRFWPKHDGLGQRVKVRELDAGWLTVVGVAGDVHHFFLDDEVRPTIYLPFTQHPMRSLNVLLKSPTSPGREARAILRSLDASQPPPDMEKLGRFFADLAGGVGVIASLMGVFAIVALILAASGIFAVMAYSVARRTREIGIRIALGARPRDVLRLIAAQAIRLTFVGLGIGCFVAFLLTRAIAKALPGVVALDAFTFAGFTAFLAAVALAASVVPSGRAMRVDPLAALRAE